MSKRRNPSAVWREGNHKTHTHTHKTHPYSVYKYTERWSLRIGQCPHAISTHLPVNPLSSRAGHGALIYTAHFRRKRPRARALHGQENTQSHGQETNARKNILSPLAIHHTNTPPRETHSLPSKHILALPQNPVFPATSLCHIHSPHSASTPLTLLPVTRVRDANPGALAKSTIWCL